MLTQLSVPIPLITPKGNAWAAAIIDYGPHWDLQWVTFVHDTGECWTFLNRDIRQEQNLTFGIPKPSPVSKGTYSSGTAGEPTEDNKRPGPKHFGVNGLSS